jgi:ribosomal protein L40E
MADYQEKMRLQYDEVVQKFKQEASRQLGRSLSDTEFQEWWRKQPTFLTFEDWLREEEEMRKMGSKPCPICGTLNSVTATVCHKCGSLMREIRPPSGGGVVAAAPRRPGAPGPGGSEGPTGSYETPSGQEAAPTTSSIPRRLFQRPGAPPPVVQKRVIKKPIESQEGQGSEGSSDQSESSSQDEL